MPGFHYVEAMLYAIDKINKDASILPNITLGSRIYDSCHSQTIGARMVKELITMTLVPPASGAQLAGVIGAHSSDLSKVVADFLRVFEIPQISYGSTASLLSDKTIYSYFFRTVPPDTLQASAMADVVVELGWNFVITISSNGVYGEKGMEDFYEAAEARGICIALRRTLSSFPSDDEFKQLIDDLNNEPKARGVILFTVQRDSRSILEALARRSSKRFYWVASDSWGNNMDIADGLEHFADGAITISQLNQPVSGFEEYFRGLDVRDKQLANNSWFRDFWQTHFRCTLKGSSSNFSQNCSGNETLLNSRLDFAPIQTVVNAVYAMAHALHDYVKQSCEGTNGICQATRPIRRSLLLTYMNSTTFKNQATGANFSFNKNQEISGSYSIFSFQESNGRYFYRKVGVWEDHGDGYHSGKLNLNMTELKWPNGSSSPPASLCSEPCAHGKVHAKKANLPIICCWNCVACGPRDIIVNSTCKKCPYGYLPNSNLTGCVKFPVIDLMSKSSSKAILAVSVVGLTCVVIVTVIFFKHNQVPLIKASSRELSGIILFGLALLFTSPWLLLAEPSRVICLCQPVVLGIALASCYAPLFMKILRIFRIFTNAMKSVGKPTLVSPASQVLIAVSLILVQCLFSVMSFFPTIPAQVERELANELFLECSLEKKVLASLLSYNMLLMGLCTFMAFKTRMFPRNFNEAKYIGLTMYFTCFVWIIFFPFYMSAGNGLHRIIWECIATISIGWITLLGLFGPKIYLLFVGVSENNDQLAMTNNSASNAAVLRVGNAVTPLNTRSRKVGENDKGNPGSSSSC